MARTIPPSEEARRVFERLGYAVSGTGAEFVAERKWRSVRVQTLCSEVAERTDDLPADDTGMRCLVTWMEAVDDLRERVLEHAPDGEWAIIGVDDDGNHEVHQPA
jgi:cellobiose phosphorylase